MAIPLNALVKCHSVLKHGIQVERGCFRKEEPIPRPLPFANAREGEAFL